MRGEFEEMGVSLVVGGCGELEFVDGWVDGWMGWMEDQ